MAIMISLWLAKLLRQLDMSAIAIDIKKTSSLAENVAIERSTRAIKLSQLGHATFKTACFRLAANPAALFHPDRFRLPLKLDETNSLYSSILTYARSCDVRQQVALIIVAASPKAREQILLSFHATPSG
ncbi:hypothetical protein LJR098_005487 [Rhizobium sp. LjRoot98]|uniref:hypothetical protein n=1 Tax=unclassified Rhizobium TaxID=2613769 RepID=UPI0012E3702C|nr:MULTISPECIES: hypothetical protein [unclassified Rhizobium]